MNRSPDVSLIPVSPADRGRLVALMKEYYAYDRIRFDGRRVGTGFKALMLDSRYGRAWFVRYDGCNVGYLVLTYCFSVEFGGRYGLIDEIYLREKFRGKGIGGKAIGFVLAQCRKEGVRTVRLEVERHNVRAQKLYKREGFFREDRNLMTRSVAGKRGRRPGGKRTT
jgi:GNAT superfamily N-acetyltransferase